MGFAKRNQYFIKIAETMAQLQPRKELDRPKDKKSMGSSRRAQLMKHVVANTMTSTASPPELTLEKKNNATTTKTQGVLLCLNPSPGESKIRGSLGLSLPHLLGKI